MRRVVSTVAWVVVAGAMFFAGRGCGGGYGPGPGSEAYGAKGGAEGGAQTRIDTVIVRDTLRDTVLVHKERLMVRTDTVWMASAADTVRVMVEIPVEQKVYRTDDYRAVVEGFRPSLVELEIYRNTMRVDRRTTVGPVHPRPRRWGVGLQAGYGFSPNGRGPYVGVGVQYCIFLW